MWLSKPNLPCRFGSALWKQVHAFVFATPLKPTLRDMKRALDFSLTVQDGKQTELRSWSLIVKLVKRTWVSKTCCVYYHPAGQWQYLRSRACCSLTTTAEQQQHYFMVKIRRNDMSFNVKLTCVRSVSCRWIFMRLETSSLHHLTRKPPFSVDVLGYISVWPVCRM